MTDTERLHDALIAAQEQGRAQETAEEIDRLIYALALLVQVHEAAGRELERDAEVTP